jgi:hypothetical protein
MDKSLLSDNNKRRMLLLSAITAGYVQWPVNDFQEEPTVPGRGSLCSEGKANAPSAIVYLLLQ